MDTMLKLAQLKYPSFPIKVRPSQATVSSPPQASLSESDLSQFMYQEMCYFSSSYEDEVLAMGDPAKMAAMTKVMQFPFTLPVSPNMLKFVTAHESRRMWWRRRRLSLWWALSGEESKASGCRRCKRNNEPRRFLISRPTVKAAANDIDHSSLSSSPSLMSTRYCSLSDHL